MKRSEVNRMILDAEKFIDRLQFTLPPFAFWSPDEWKTKGPEYSEIRDNMLGWDITDFGSGDFNRVGLLLFTIRNGNLDLGKLYSKPYAEKMMIVEEEQVTPYHFHWNKMEDIINRGGGNLLIQLYPSTESGEFGKNPVRISMDGHNYDAPAGTVVCLKPGESITLPTGLYQILVMEVSQVNDDNTDNRFYEAAGRFPKIEEDEPPMHLLCNEYPPAKGPR
jgi:D-lyxose ketol-isomerase